MYQEREDRETLEALFNDGNRSPSTILIYTKAILTIRNKGFSMHDPQGLLLDLTKENYKPSTINVYLTAIIVYLKSCDPVNMKLLNQYHDIHEQNHAVISQSYKRSAFTDSQQINKVTWDDLVKHRDSLKEYLHDKNSIYSYLLLCLNTKIPPKRNDWADVLVMGEGHSDVENYVNDHRSITANFYVLDKKQLVLNNYKTKKTYGTKRVTIPDELHDDIVTSMTRLGTLPSPQTCRPLFQHEDGRRWSRNYMSQFFRNIMPGSNLGVSLLRKIVKTTWMERGIGQIDELAHAMDHSARAAHAYYDDNTRQSAQDNTMGIYLS